MVFSRTRAARTAVLKQILAGLRGRGRRDTSDGRPFTRCARVLVISSEESLITLSIDAFTPVLVQLMQVRAQSRLHAPSRAPPLTSMADILPNSRAAIVHYGALPTFCSRLLTIEYIDLAEQSLQALEKLSQDQGASCLREGGDDGVFELPRLFRTRHATRVAADSREHVPPAPGERLLGARIRLSPGAD